MRKILSKEVVGSLVFKTELFQASLCFQNKTGLDTHSGLFQLLFLLFSVVLVILQLLKLHSLHFLVTEQGCLELCCTNAVEIFSNTHTKIENCYFLNANCCIHIIFLYYIFFSGIHIAGVSGKEVVSMHTEETEHTGSPRAVIRENTACPGHPGCPRASAPHAGSD